MVNFYQQVDIKKKKSNKNKSKGWKYEFLIAIVLAQVYCSGWTASLN